VYDRQEYINLLYWKPFQMTMLRRGFVNFSLLEWSLHTCQFAKRSRSAGCADVGACMKAASSVTFINAYTKFCHLHNKIAEARAQIMHPHMQQG
jgi:hypothetical protein